MNEERHKRTSTYGLECAELGPGRHDFVRAEDYDRLEAALRRIANHPTVERNPDGVDQAAHSMQLIARMALRRAP